MIMTTGLFLDVTIHAGDKLVIPGDGTRTEDGKVTLHVSVQCSNIAVIDRVQVLLNGCREANLNFTRAAQPKLFGNGVVQFDRDIR